MNTIEVIKNWTSTKSEVLDLGCGDGEILKTLKDELQINALGVEINQSNINICIQSGLNVIQQNIDDGLGNIIHIETNLGSGSQAYTTESFPNSQTFNYLIFKF